MSGAQRVIKAFAIALAVILILVIFSGILSVISLAGLVVWGGDTGTGEVNEIWSEECKTEQCSSETVSEIRRLSMNIGATNMRVVEASGNEEVRVETSNEYIRVWQDGDTLRIVEESHGWFGWWGKVGELTLYIAPGIEFERVEIEAGAGSLDIDNLVVKNLDLELGAGKTTVSAVEVTTAARIEGGAGVIEIESGTLRNLDLSLGAGRAVVAARVLGNSKIDSGVGKLELNLLGGEGDYRLTIDKGLGSVTANGKSLEDGTVWGTGENMIRIDSGVGAVEIKTLTE